MKLPAIYLERGASISIPELTGTEQIYSQLGDVSLQVAPAQINVVRQGWLANLVINNGSFYPCQEYLGRVVFDATLNRRHGRITGVYRRVSVDGASAAQLHAISFGNNPYLISQGGNTAGFEITNIPIGDDWTFYIRLATPISDGQIRFGNNVSIHVADYRKEAQSIALTHSNGVLRFWINTDFLTGQASVSDLNLAGNAIAFEGTDELPLYVRRMALWNRVLTNDELREMPIYFIRIPTDNLLIHYNIDSSETSPIPNLVSNNYNAENKTPAIAYVPMILNPNIHGDALGSPGYRMPAEAATRITDGMTEASFSDYRPRGFNLPSGNDGKSKFIIMSRAFRRGARPHDADVRLIETNAQ